MNILAWIRENKDRLEVTPADDPSEYSIDFGSGSLTLTWSVGDEKYSVDLSLHTGHGVSTTTHERYDYPSREIEFSFKLVIL